MLAGHSIVTLSEAKLALRIRPEDTQRDDEVESLCADSSDMVERITGRRILYRGLYRAVEDGVELATGEAGVDAVLSLSGATFPDTPSTVLVALADVTPTVSGTVTITGRRNEEAQVEVLAFAGERSFVAGTKLFDEVTRIEVTDSDGTGDGTISVRALAPYRERHSCEGAPALYTVNRPIISLFTVEEGTAPIQLFPLDSAYFVVNNPLGRVGRIAKTVGFIDFPEDYFFRYASQVENQWGAWSPDARIGYVGGYRRPADVNGILREECLRCVVGFYRERERKDVDVTAVSAPGQRNVEKADWRGDMAKALEAEKSLSFTGERCPS